MTPRHSVLVVEDNDLYRRGLIDLLEGGGFRIAGVAATAGEGLRLAFETEPDLVVLDLHLPDAHGLDVIERIGAACPTCQIVVLSVSVVRGDLIRALRAGAAGYLTKDQPPEGLMAALHGLIRGEAPLSRQLATFVIEEMRRDSRRRALASLIPDRDHLTPRQLEILRMLASGMSTSAIADDLFLSVETVRWHVKSILRNLGVSSRAEAIACLEELHAV